METATVTLDDVLAEIRGMRSELAGLRADLEAYKALLPEPGSTAGRLLARRMRRSDTAALLLNGGQ
ncbi:MAG TPA: hypothetical protein VN820_01805 [Acidimicrobiales bacterium]|nr:hypothetical protein [Acidimicrobiales bacterium]